MFDRSLRRVVEQLRAVYGEPESPSSADPSALILRENVANLVDDTRRAIALDRLRQAVGTRPDQTMDEQPTRADDRDERPRKVAERLREAREYLGLSQPFVADQTGIPRIAISAIENGNRKVDAR